MTVTLPPGYKPSEKEMFLNDLQLEYFRQRLIQWRLELLEEANETLTSLQQNSPVTPDLGDRASVE